MHAKKDAQKAMVDRQLIKIQIGENWDCGKGNYQNKSLSKYTLCRWHSPVMHETWLYLFNNILFDIYMYMECPTYKYPNPWHPRITPCKWKHINRWKQLLWIWILHLQLFGLINWIYLPHSEEIILSNFRIRKLKMYFYYY